MEAIELIELIGRGEDSHTQFKQAQDVTNAQSLAGELVAFSNSKGGRILIVFPIWERSWGYRRRMCEESISCFPTRRPITRNLPLILKPKTSRWEIMWSSL